MVNKALMHKDWKRIRLITSFMIGHLTYLVVKIFGKMSSVKSHGAYYISKGNFAEVMADRFFMALFRGETLLLISGCIIFIMAGVLFYDLRNENHNLIASMPFKRETVIGNKLILGFSIIIGSLLLIFPLIILAYTANIEYIGDQIALSHLFGWLLLKITLYCAIFSFIMMTHSFMGNVVAASIIAPIMLLLPEGMGGLVSVVLRGFFKYDEVSHIIDGCYHLMSKIGFVFYDDYIMWYNTIINGNPTDEIVKKVIVLALLTVIFSIVTVFTYKKSSFENNGKFLIFQSLGKFFVVGFTVCTSLLGFAILIGIFEVAFYGKIMKLILLIPGLVVGYLLSSKLTQTELIK